MFLFLLIVQLLGQLKHRMPTLQGGNMSLSIVSLLICAFKIKSLHYFFYEFLVLRLHFYNVSMQTMDLQSFF